MKEKRDLKIGIKSDSEFFDELKLLADRLDDGWLPEKTIERLYFDNLPMLLKHLTPKRFELLTELRRMGHASINALAKHLHRQYRNVFDDVKAMERLGLVEKDASGHFYVPWDEIDATFRLAA
ncbi:MAG: MarR family transcriptional regulator [Trichlorobacter sp.]